MASWLIHIPTSRVRKSLIERPGSYWPSKRADLTRGPRLFASTILLLFFFGSGVRAAPVIVEGGPEGLGNSYQWTITNSYDSPIVKVEIPHYRANLFYAPKGWTTSCTNLVEVGGKDAPGVCTSSAQSPVDGIASGRSASFQIQLATGQVKRGFATARFTHADGATHEVSGVFVPIPESMGDRYIPLFGLGAILTVFAAIQAARRRKRRVAAIHA